MSDTGTASDDGVIENSDGSLSSVNPDGSTSTSMSDGSCQTFNQDGSLTGTSSDGSMWHQDPDGGVTTWDARWGTVFTDICGTQTSVGADCTMITMTNAGTQTLTSV